MLSRFRLFSASLLALSSLAAAAEPQPLPGSPESAPTQLLLQYKFSESSSGFAARFADYPAGQESFFELQADYRELPKYLGAKGALFISGNNHSDDLFMFVKNRIGGLRAGGAYSVTLHIQIASNAPNGSVGIGGSPASSVYLKAGVANVEPVAVNRDGFMEMNVDKGVQSQPGEDAQVLGNIGVDTTTDKAGNSRYVLKNFRSQQFLVEADSAGNLWLFTGTDSGFEGTTSLYFTKIKATLHDVGSIVQSGR
ncbi:MAG TPA: hypothetical protein VF614_10155 [Chthoniobacteraceae bacterium]|jgi:hypothetical protein